MNRNVIDLETGEVEKPKEMMVVSDVRASIEKAKNVIETTKIISMAKAAEAFYAAQGMEENAQKAREVSLWAQRKAGQFLDEMPKNEGGRPTETPSTVEGVMDAPTLADLDIDYHESHRWQMLAAIPEEQFQEYIDDKLANGYELTTGGLLKIAKTQRRKEDIQKQKDEIEQGSARLPQGVFEVIVLDPPWAYGTEYDPEGRRAANPYPEMSLEEIQALRLPAAKDCILWLWTTHKFMRYSFALLDAWGFRDVAIVTWEKDRMGLGTWLRSQTEFCIMAVKGKPTVDLTNQTTIIHGKMREHSRKPDEFYAMVESLCVGRKLDFFSRENRKGWEQYGNDLAKFD